MSKGVSKTPEMEAMKNTPSPTRGEGADGLSMETDPSHPDTTRADVPGERIRVWRVVGQSFAVLCRNIVPFLALTLAVRYTVVLMSWEYLPLFVVPASPTFSALFYDLVPFMFFDGLSKVPVEAVISMAVWLDLDGRRLSLKGAFVTVARGIPRVLDRPFWRFVSTIFAVAFLRGLVVRPYYVTLSLVGAWEPGSGPMRQLAPSASGSLLNALIDTRLLVLLPVAAIERTDVLDSFRRSWRLTKRHWARILGVIVCVGVFATTLSYLVVFGISRLHPAMAKLPGSLIMAVGYLINGFIRTCWAVVAAVCYRHIRVGDGENTADRVIVSPGDDEVAPRLP